VESLGSKLKAAREEKGYTVDQVSRDTNIAGRYIEALEEEKFSIFPGEPYLLGFLRNYGEYLGLDVPGLLFLYRSLQIEAQPVPVERLLRSPPRRFRMIGAAAILLTVLAAGAGGYFFLTRSMAPAPEAVKPRAVAEYVLDRQDMEQRFYRGDSILVPVNDTRYKIALANLGEAVTLETPGGEKRMDLGQEIQIDLNMDGVRDLRITVMDFAKNDPGPGALIRFELASAPDAVGMAEAAGEPPDSPVLPGKELAAAPVILSSPNAYPFTLQAAFQGYCMFRWEILEERDRRERNERYFQRADELNIQAQNGIRVWISNAAAVKLQVIGGGRTVPLDAGGVGEAVVADVRWIRDDEGRFRLVLSRLE
jgi:cytoskeletal protein RodZ